MGSHSEAMGMPLFKINIPIKYYYTGLSWILKWKRHAGRLLLLNTGG